MIQRPLLPVAMVYLAGILLGNFIPLPLGVIFPVALAVAGLTLFWRRSRGVLMYPLLLLAGMVNLALHTAVISPNDLRVLVGENQVGVTLRGELAETPYQRLYEQKQAEAVRTQAKVRVNALRRAGGQWQPASGTVAVSTPGELPAEFFSGQTVEVTGALGPPEPPMTPYSFDYPAYLRHLGIDHQLWTRLPEDWTLISPPGNRPPMADRFFAWGKKVLAIGQPDVDESVKLLWTITLGWKTPLTDEVSQPFMESGTIHIFAISGLHMVIISGILVGLLRAMRVPRRWCGFIVIPLIWFYTDVTGWQPSAIRATVMMTVVIAGWWVRRPGDLLNSLAASALIILVWQPQQIGQASFQLSFFVVLCIALISPALEKFRRRLFAVDPFLPDQLRPKWQVWLRETGFWLSASLTTSLAAWLGSVPLVAWYFHLFTPVSLLANLIVVPLSGLALAGNLASLLAGGWWPGLAGLFNNSAWLFMWLMIRVSEWCAALPGGYFWVRAPSLLGVATYYAVLVAVTTGCLRRPRWRVWVGLGLAGMLGVLGFHWWQERAMTRLTVLPLNGGSAVFFDPPGQANDLLVDCGNARAAEAETVPFLHGQGVSRLERMVLTHGTLKDVGGTELVRTNFGVQQVITSVVRFRSSPYRKIVEGLASGTNIWRQVARGDAIGSWKVLHPLATDKFSQGDDATMVMLGEFSGVRILLLSDLGRAGQEALLNREPDLHADIVVTGLPEKSEPVGDWLLEAVKPAVIVVADSNNPVTRRASAALKERLRGQHIPVFYTRETGAVTVTIGKGSWAVEGMEGQKAEMGKLKAETGKRMEGGGWNWEKGTSNPDKRVGAGIQHSTPNIQGFETGRVSNTQTTNGVSGGSEGALE